MTIRVLIFATLAHRIGKRELSLELPGDATVQEALDILSAQYPAVFDLRGRLAMAVNQNYADTDQILSDDDELALIPPVSGG